MGKSAGSSAASEEKADIVGWVTIHNQSGTEFPQARIKLMAGDVAKINPRNNGIYSTGRDVAMLAGAYPVNPQVTQKAFDDFHLYDLNRTVSLRDGEIKQIQFIEASGVTLARNYLYDGAASNLQPISNFGNNPDEQRSYGLNPDNTKVQIIEEVKNTETNHLGIPLPAGRIRLYRRDSDGQMEFVGESTINHTPAEDAIKITTGSAFDIKGSRRQTDFHVNQGERILDETFEIKLTNQKPEPVNVNVIEHLYRGDNWEVQHNSADYTKLDSHTIQFPLQVPAKGEATFTYSVRYSWKRAEDKTRPELLSATPAQGGGQKLFWLRERVDIVCQQNRLARDGIFQKQADYAHIDAGGYAAQPSHAVAEYSRGRGINRHRLRHEQPRKARDLHLEGTVRRVHTTGNHRTVKAPVPQHNPIHRYRVCVGRAARGSTYRHMLAWQHLA